MSAEEKIRNFILDNFLFTDDQSALSNSDSLIDRGVVDSTGILEIINFLEETFAVEIAEEDMVPENLDSVDSIVAFLEKK